MTDETKAPAAKKSNPPVWALALGILTAPLLILWRAYVLSVAWGWFVVPLGAPAVGTLWATGLVCVWMLVADDFKLTDESDPIVFLVTAVSAPAVTLGFCALIHAFM